MRAILFQHLVKTVMDRFEKMVGCPSARSKAVGLGWLSEDETQILGVRWDAENHQHVKDSEVTPLSIAVVGGATGAGGNEQQAFGGDSIPCDMQAGGAVHVTHPDHVVGGGQPQAWKRLHKLERSAVWVASGAFLRREHMQRSPLAQRLATVTGC
eukprot:s4205_g6.t1